MNEYSSDITVSLQFSLSKQVRWKWNSKDVCQNFTCWSVTWMNSLLNWIIVLNTGRFSVCACVYCSHGSSRFQKQQEGTYPNLYSFSSLSLNHICLHPIGQNKSYSQSQSWSGRTLKITGQPSGHEYRDRNNWSFLCIQSIIYALMSMSQKTHRIILKFKDT